MYLREQFTLKIKNTSTSWLAGSERGHISAPGVNCPLWMDVRIHTGHVWTVNTEQSPWVNQLCQKLHFGGLCHQECHGRVSASHSAAQRLDGVSLPPSPNASVNEQRLQCRFSAGTRTARASVFAQRQPTRASGGYRQPQRHDSTTGNEKSKPVWRVRRTKGGRRVAAVFAWVLRSRSTKEHDSLGCFSHVRNCKQTIKKYIYRNNKEKKADSQTRRLNT